jgi:hypothetical protein
MQKQRTEPGIIRVICASSWPGKADPPRRYKSELCALPAVVQKQDAIGWQSFLEGRPSVGWSEVQHRYYEFLDGRRTGLRWLTALIQKLWDVAWDMWDHRNRVLHDQEHSVARDLQIQQITDEFATRFSRFSSRGEAPSGGLIFSNDCRPIKRHGSSRLARAERRDGQRQAHQRDTIRNVWNATVVRDHQYLRRERKKKTKRKKNGSDLITFPISSRRPFPWTQSLRPKGGVKPLRQ